MFYVPPSASSIEVDLHFPSHLPTLFHFSAVNNISTLPAVQREVDLGSFLSSAHTQLLTKSCRSDFLDVSPILYLDYSRLHSPISAHPA